MPHICQGSANDQLFLDLLQIVDCKPVYERGRFSPGWSVSSPHHTVIKTLEVLESLASQDSLGSKSIASRKRSSGEYSRSDFVALAHLVEPPHDGDSANAKHCVSMGPCVWNPAGVPHPWETPWRRPVLQKRHVLHAGHALPASNRSLRHDDRADRPFALI